MKFLKYNLLTVLLTVFAFGFTGCSDADPEFVHTDNFISAMTCWAGRLAGSPSLKGTITEYDKAGNPLEKGFKPEDAEGGSGVIVFVVPAEDRNTFDLTDVYLEATVTYDEFIYPSLSGRHNILVDAEHPEGMVISVKSGVGTVRKYRIMGIYE